MPYRVNWSKLKILQVYVVPIRNKVTARNINFQIEQFDTLSKPITLIASRWNLSKFVILKHSGREILHLEPFVAFFSTIYMLRSLFVKIFQQNMGLNQRNLREVLIDLKLKSLDLGGNTTDSKHYRRAHVHIDIYIDLYIRDGICPNLSF